MAVSLGLTFLSLQAPRVASAATGIDVLDDAAIAVIHPDKALLIAITNAGSRLVAVGEQGLVIYSDDSGASWLQASVPVEVTLTSVAFASPLVGWAAGHFGTILKTCDGGKTWRLQLNGIEANELTLAAANDPATQNSSAPGAPLAMRRAQAFMQDGPDKPFLCMLVLDEKDIIVFGAFRLTMMSRDGGESWKDWSLHIFDPLSHNLYGAVAAGRALYLVGESGLVFCSTDGGNDFAKLAAPADITLFGALAVSDGSLIVFGVAGSAFRSQDGGTDWTALNITTQANLTAGLILQSGHVIIFSEAGEAFVSVDHGISFKSVPGLPQSSIFDVAQSTDSALVIVGAAGVVRLPLSALNI